MSTAPFKLHTSNLELDRVPLGKISKVLLLLLSCYSPRHPFMSYTRFHWQPEPSTESLLTAMDSMNMNGDGNSAGVYLERLEGFRRSDAARDDMVTELVNKLSHLEAKFNEKCDDYNNEVESRRMWQAKASANERAVTSMKQASVKMKLLQISSAIH